MYQDNRPVNVFGLFVVVAFMIAMGAIGFLIAGKKFDVGPFAPTSTPTATATPTGAPEPTTRLVPTSRPAPAPLPTLPPGADEIVARFAGQMKSDPRITLAKITFLCVCPSNTLLEFSEGQLCFGLLIPNARTTPSEAESKAFWDDGVKALLGELAELGWYGKLFGFVMQDDLGGMITAALEFYRKPGDDQLYYKPYDVIEPLTAPAWLLGE